ncbi:aminomethyltransferase family protein [Leisingera daeponensis]|uniref:Aminomethyltransferase family protein n=1 Tax=Leisingera daeponensis TaxID=405746 RepID=A0ABS7NK91_9RHOB|nr:aminomethyltransferase family protein [Leisingera daeponensis]MBY6141341.1 aminomethyltransferase family protein [Leisingera daeponensis]
MTASWRFSTLADRHRAMGSDLEDWSGMGTAWTYDKDQTEEYMAIRTKAGFMDVSGLKKVHLVGPHASHVIDRATTRNPEKIKPGRSTYACMLNDDGKFIDDCVIYRMGPNSWMVVHGSGQGHETLTMAAQGRDVDIRFDDNLHDISLQGPAAVDFLEEQGVPGIRDVVYFSHIHTTLWDKPVTISRTGYTGERGYEIFCRGQDAPHIWDNLVEKGAPKGIIPTRFTTLDLLRAESYLLFFPYDNSEMYPFENEKCGDTLWELGLDFTVSPGKTGFRGAEEHYRLKGKERFKIYGVKLEGSEPAEEGAPLLKDGKQVGVVTIGMYSPLNEHNVGIARMPVDCAEPGVQLTVKNSTGEIPCVAAEMPFHDPEKKRRTAKG